MSPITSFTIKQFHPIFCYLISTLYEGERLLKVEKYKSAKNNYSKDHA